MRVILFGASGMVGQGVLRECLLDPRVERVVAVGRREIANRDPKLEQVVVPDLANLSGAEERLTGFDAAFFCLGVSAAGLTEAQYSAATYDLTLSVAQTLARLNPAMTFVYVSGAGTDSTERGPVMWARVKGRTENALLRLPFKAAYMFRPGIIQPMHGERSRTPVYRFFYVVAGPVLPVLRRWFPKAMTTTEQMGRAMLAVARDGYAKPILETIDINEL